MRRIHLGLIGAVVLVVVGLAVVGIYRATAGTTSEASRAGTTTAQPPYDLVTTDVGVALPPPRPTVQSTRPFGSPAIRPRTAPVRTSTPTFTAQDVEEYFRVRGLSGSIRLDASGPITVENVEFLPGREVAARLNRGINQPDDVLLCLATLRGSFGVAGPSEPLAYNSGTAYVVFDAHTGNTLMFGLGE